MEHTQKYTKMKQSHKKDQEKSSFLSFPPKLFTLMVDIVILNPIGFFKLIDNTCFVLRAIFYLKISLMIMGIMMNLTKLVTKRSYIYPCTQYT